MLENWMWDKNVMKRVSKHYQSEEPIPDEMVDTKIAAKNLNEATFTLK
jgi:Zn-dependent oligopeptidase